MWHVEGASGSQSVLRVAASGRQWPPVAASLWLDVAGRTRRLAADVVVDRPQPELVARHQVRERLHARPGCKGFSRDDGSARDGSDKGAAALWIGSAEGPAALWDDSDKGAAAAALWIGSAKGCGGSSPTGSRSGGGHRRPSGTPPRPRCTAPRLHRKGGRHQAVTNPQARHHPAATIPRTGLWERGEPAGAWGRAVVCMWSRSKPSAAACSVAARPSGRAQRAWECV